MSGSGEPTPATSKPTATSPATFALTASGTVVDSATAAEDVAAVAERANPLLGVGVVDCDGERGGDGA